MKEVLRPLHPLSGVSGGVRSAGCMHILKASRRPVSCKPQKPSMDCRLPLRIRKAVKKAADSLRSSVLSFTALSTPKPAGVDLVL